MTKAAAWTMVVLGCLFALWASDALAEAGGPVRTLTLGQAVDYALQHHPSVRAARALQTQADAAVEAGRVGYLPQVDVVGQENRASVNQNPGTWIDIPGFPGVVPAVEGPMHDSFGLNSWNSGASLFVAEDVAGLLRQMSLVDVALARREGAGFGLRAQELAVAFAAADAFMVDVAALETVKATQSGVQRARTFATAVGGLVKSGLRPGADASRAQAELAFAKDQELRAMQALGVARATLAQALGVAAERVEPRPGALLKPAPGIALPESPSPANPLLREAQAGVEAAHSAVRATRLQYLPRVYVAGFLFSQGGGLGGGTITPGGGLVPSVPNWAVALDVVVPLTELLTTRAQLRGAVAGERLAAARYGETALGVESELRRAQAVLEGARGIAANAPAELAAARATWAQNNARYRAGLMTALDVADAERLLTQAEVDNAVARVNVWRAMLLVARAAGDLGPFFAAYRSVGPGGK